MSDDYVHIGFTGTRETVTSIQELGGINALKQIRTEVVLLEKRTPPIIFHHGDCVGADELFHVIAVDLGFKTHIHPPVDSSNRAFCKGDFTSLPLHYMSRNRALVQACAWLIATPLTERMPRGTRIGGTWSTIRYARKLLPTVNIFIIGPSGVRL